MNNAGQTDSELTTEDNVIHDNQKGSHRSPILLMILAGILIICLLIGIQAFGILYSIVFPPSPPSPDNLLEIRHTPIDHGVDEWVYRTQQDACEIAQYYVAEGGVCSYATTACGKESEEGLSLSSVGQHVATCIGEEQFNIFAYRWEANIADGYQYDDGSTQIGLLREVFWTGAVPPRLDPRSGFDFNG